MAHLEEFCQIAILVHLDQNIAASNKLALHVHLWHGWPLTVTTKSVAQHWHESVILLGSHSACALLLSISCAMSLTVTLSCTLVCHTDSPSLTLSLCMALSVFCILSRTLTLWLTICPHPSLSLPIRLSSGWQDGAQAGLHSYELMKRWRSYMAG